MSDLEHGQTLMKKAQNDLRALTGMLDSETFTEDIFGFHAQQSVEKALKAWISALGIEYPLTHNNEKLLDILVMNGHDVKQFYDLVEFNPYAVEFRYDPLNNIAGSLDREQIIERVTILIKFVDQIIKELENVIE